MAEDGDAGENMMAAGRVVTCCAAAAEHEEDDAVAGKGPLHSG